MTAPDFRTAEIDFGEVAEQLNNRIEALACDLLGKPSNRTSSELRFTQKGGICVVINGARRGRWYDHRADEGGDAIELICTINNQDRRGALEFGLDWLGRNGEIPPSVAAHAGAEPDRAAKVATIIGETGPAVGAEVVDYFRGRGIAEQAASLSCIGFRPRAWGDYGAAVFFATDDMGVVRAVHQVYLAGGRKAPIATTKRTNGPLTGAVVRLPGNMPVILAEGPENALSVWQATGRETWACLGVSNIGNAPVSPNAEVVIARDADVPGSAADMTLQRAAAALVGRGIKVRIATPPRYPDLEKSDFNDVLRRDGEEAVMSAINSAAVFRIMDGGVDEDQRGAGRQQSCRDGWPDPEPLIAPGEAERPYPLDSLPPVMRAAVLEYQSYGQQPASLIACSALASASLVTQGLANVARDDNLVGPIGLFFAVVAGSGERKTSADREFTRPLREWMVEQREQLAPDVDRARAANQAWEAERDGLLAKIKGASGRKSTGEEADIAALRQRLDELEGEHPTEPILPSLFFEDSTPEALAADIAEGWPSSSLWSDEAGLIVGSHGMADDSMMRFVGLINRLWDGATFERRRRSAKSVVIKGRRLTACLMMQPLVLMRLLGASGGASRGMGLIARCLVAWPGSTIGLRAYRPAPEGTPAVARFHRRLRDLLDLPLPVTGADMVLDPPALRLSPTAFSIWRELHDGIEAELSRSGEFGAIPDIGAKIAENAARIAGVFHIVENGPAGEIAADTMNAAARIAVWHLAEARRVIGATEKPQAAADAELLLEWLLKRPTDDVEPRQILRLGPVPLRDKKRRDAAIETLTETFHLGRQAGALALNPKLRSAR